MVVAIQLTVTRTSMAYGTPPHLQKSVFKFPSLANNVKSWQVRIFPSIVKVN